MNKIIISPPQPQQKREHIFSVRLTSSEHRQLQQLAQQMDVSLSHLVRHHGGLSIARALMKAHGGRMWAESDGLGKGAKTQGKPLMFFRHRFNSLLCVIVVNLLY